MFPFKVKILSVVNLSESQPPGTVILDPADLEYTSLDAIIQAETASMHSSQNNQNEVASCDNDNSPRVCMKSTGKGKCLKSLVGYIF